MILVLLGLQTQLLYAGDEDDVTLPTHESDVDTTSYTRALYDRFTGCLAAEGTVLEAADPATVQQTLDTLSPVLTFISDGRCTASAAAVTACTIAVNATTCQELETDITAGLSGGSTTASPPWAQRYGDALVDRIASCYAAETGSPLTADESADLHTFSGFMAQALAGVATACPVDVVNAATCTAAIGTMPCSHLSDMIADDSATDESELLVKDFVQGCPGFLACE